MATADEQIRVSDQVKRKLDSRRRDGESYNDVLERLLNDEPTGAFEDGFGRWTDAEAEQVREARREAADDRKRRMRERTEDTA